MHIYAHLSISSIRRMKDMNINAKDDIHLAVWKKLVISVILGAIVFMIFHFEWMLSLTNVVNDYVYQQPSATDLDIKIVCIDDKTLNALGQPTLWSRTVYADLINKLSSEGSCPAVIGLDVMFTGNKSAEEDKVLAEACRNAGNVVVGGDVASHSILIKDNGSLTEKTYIDEVYYPYSELKDVTTFGLVVTNQDYADDHIRCAIMGLPYGSEWIECLAPAVYRRYCEVKGISVHDFSKDKYQKYRFTYTEEKAGSPFDCCSFIDVLDGKISPGYFKDSIVFVGAYADGLDFDKFNVPIHKETKLYGVEIHANILDAIHKGNLQTDVNRDILGVIYGVLAAAFCFFLFSYTLPAGALISVLTFVLQFLTCRMMYNFGYYINFSVFPMAIIVIYIAMVIYQYLTERAHKAKINKAFKMYVAPQIVDEVSKNGDYKLELGGRNKDIAVLFVDIRGFTTMSEGMRPEDVVAVLNEYFDIITNAIFKNGGTLDKFIGDACMAVFNSPFDLDDYVYKAVCTAWDIAAGSAVLSPKLMEKFGRTVSYGIGVNCGEAVIGNIGSPFRMDYTAIGDTVNTSSRLESNAKAGQILISEEVLRRLGDRVTVEEIGVIPLKGKKIGINVYNMTGIPGRDE